MSVSNCVNHLVGYYQEKTVAQSERVSSLSVVPSFYPGLGFGPCWSSTKQVQVISGDLEQIRKYAKADSETERQTAAAMIGGIATVVLAGASAYVLKQAKRDYSELAHAKQLLQSLDGSEKAQQVRPILCKHIEILEAKCTKVRHIALFAISLFATAAVAFTAGMLEISWLVTASIVAAVAISAMGVFALVWHSDDETSLPSVMQKQLQMLNFQ